MSDNMKDAENLLHARGFRYATVQSLLPLLGKSDPHTCRLGGCRGSEFFHIADVTADRWTRKKDDARKEDKNPEYVRLTKADVESISAVMWEWDHGSVEEQLARADKLQGTPLEPDWMMWTGAKSLHCGKAIERTTDIEAWEAQARGIADHLNSDPSIVSVDQVMRQPGSRHHKTGRYSLLWVKPGWQRVSLSAIAGVAPPIERAARKRRRQAKKKPERKQGKAPSMASIREAMDAVPLRADNTGTYNEYVSLVFGLRSAIEAAGEDPSKGAEILAERSDANKEDLIRAYERRDPDGPINPGTLFFQARKLSGDPELCADYCPSPTEIIQELLAKYGCHFRRGVGNSCSWWLWRANHWAHSSTHCEANHEICRIFREEHWGVFLAPGYVDDIRRRIRNHVSEERFNPQDERDDMLFFKNRCLNLKTGASEPHHPDNKNSWVLPWSHVGGAQCYGILRFLHDRLPEVEDFDLYISFCWAALTRYRPKAFLELVSENSNTGKSVLGCLIEACLGPGAAISMDLKRFEDRSQRFETSKLKNKRLVRFDECGHYVGPLDNLKRITGGDPVSGEMKGSNDFQDISFQGVVVLIGNAAVRCHDTSDAVHQRRRTVWVERPVPIGSRKPMLERDGDRWTGELVPEVPRFINWILREGQERGGYLKELLSNPDTEGQRRASARVQADTDPVMTWALERLFFHKPASGADGTDRQEVFKNWQAWTEMTNSNRGMSRDLFMKRLRRIMMAVWPGYEARQYGRQRLGWVMPGLSFDSGRGGTPLRFWFFPEQREAEDLFVEV